MMMMKDPFAAKDKMMKNFLRMGTRDRLRLVLFVLLFVGAILIWPILFCVKVDGETSASWVLLWTPLWVYDALGLWYFIHLVKLGTIEPSEGMEDDWEDPFPLPMRVLALFKWVLLIFFQIFVTLRLDEDIDWSYAVVGSPLLVWVGLQLLAHIHKASRPIPVEESILQDEESWGAMQDEAMQDEESWGAMQDEAMQDEESWGAMQDEARSALGQYFLIFIQLVLIMMKLDHQLSWSWWVVSQPLWVLMLGHLIGFCSKCLHAWHLGAGAEGMEEDLSDEEKARVATASQIIRNVICSCCCWGCTLVSMVLAVNAIAGADYSAFVIFIPQFMIAGLLLCCITCIVCCVRGMPGEDIDELLRIIDIEQGPAVDQRGSYNTFNSYTPVDV